MIGGVEQAAERRVFAEVVEKRDAATLVDVVRRRVAPGSIVHTRTCGGHTKPSPVQPIWNTEPSTTRTILSTPARVFIRTKLKGRGTVSRWQFRCEQGIRPTSKITLSNLSGAVRTPAIYGRHG